MARRKLGPMAKPAVKPDLAAWARAQSKRGSKASWQSWPDDARADIIAVIRMCDGGEAKVSTTAMLGRLRETYGVVATRPMLDKFVWSLGRRGWTLP